VIFRHTLKKDFSNYRSNIVVQNGNSDIAIKAAQDLANKHPDNSIIVRFVNIGAVGAVGLLQYFDFIR
jgi:hypothetical protein